MQSKTDCRLRLRYRHLATSTKQCCLTPDRCGRLANWTKHTCCLWFWPIAPLYGNMTSSTKPEVYNVLHYNQRRTEPRPQVTCTENLVKFGRVVFEICEQTDRQTDTLITILRNPTEAEVTNVRLAMRYRHYFSLGPVFPPKIPLTLMGD